MDFPNFIPNGDLTTRVSPEELLSYKKAIAQIFSDRSEKIENFVWATLNDASHILPEFYNSPERVNFASEYYNEKFSDENGMYPMPGNPSEEVFRLLTKYPNIIGSLLEETERTPFEKLSPSTKMDILFAGYHEYCLSYNRDSGIYNGTVQYQAIQNIHGDVTLMIVPYKQDVQRELFPDMKPAIIELEEDISEGIHMYQETTSLFVGLCLLYKRAGGSKEALLQFIDSLSGSRSRTPNAADVGLNESAVHFALRCLADESLGYDTTGEYEYTSLIIYGGHHSKRHPEIAIHQAKSLVVLKEDPNGKIQFGKDMFFTSGFEIPLEDIFGILLLLYRFPGRSGVTNRELLRVFADEYSPIDAKN
ncbi:TPA: hypothetical protein DCZ36_00300 [Candidatus Gracilibacteria bacterium]|nr:hypothetical protein [Candidatus Gracilibacteria bacterium]